jgi:hypothetical protein
MRLVWGAGVLCAVALVTGCGSSSKEVITLDTVEKAAFKTEGVGTARVTFKGSVTFNHDHAQRYSFKGQRDCRLANGLSKDDGGLQVPGPRSRVHQGAVRSRA